MDPRSLRRFALLAPAILWLLATGPSPQPAMAADDGGQAGPLRIGWASTDLTPEEPVVLTGFSRARVSQGVADPITAVYWRMARASRVLDRFELQKTEPTVPVEVHVIRLGDMAIATNPFELYLDFGIRMKARSRAVQTFVVQLAGSGSYVPTARSVAGGAYGAIPESTEVGPEGGRELVQRTLELLDALWTEK